jgi:uncharacterized phage-associated protein
MSQYSAITVANKFLELAKRDRVPLTNMQLQKLVYIAHGWNLVLLDKPLFYNNVHAWEWGPVVPKLYKPLSKYKAGYVTDFLPSKGESIAPDAPELKVIEGVWKAYGKYSGLQLSAITHTEGTPWSEVWKTNRYGIIPNELIAQHYRQLLDEPDTADTRAYA